MTVFSSAKNAEAPPLHKSLAAICLFPLAMACLGAAAALHASSRACFGAGWGINNLGCRLLRAGHSVKAAS